MKAIIVPDIDDATATGSVEIRRWPEGHGEGISGLAICCPGCGSKSWLPINREHGGWTLVSESPLEIAPSVFHKKENGGCGWHGWLQNGEWKTR